MPGTGNAAPEGYRSVTPYLAVDDAERAIGFYAEAFGARERMRLEVPGGAFEAPRGETASVSIHLYVSDADAVSARALAAGATATRPAETHFYGDRGGMLRDPFGHHWHAAHRVEGVPLEEAKRRMAALSGAG